MRPFFPGGDYEHYDYPEGCVVLDNPPFSILASICRFYIQRKIPFFLFAPSLTAFSNRTLVREINHIICDAQIIYENGARVKTSFITNFGGDIVAQTSPELTRAINRVSAQLRKEHARELPKYEYPPHVVTAALLQRYARYGVKLTIRRDDCRFIAALDAQRPERKSIYGGGLLLSEKAAAEKAAAEKAAAEKAAAEKAAAYVWQLSAREIALVRQLGGGDGAAALDAGCDIAKDGSESGQIGLF